MKHNMTEKGKEAYRPNPIPHLPTETRKKRRTTNREDTD